MRITGLGHLAFAATLMGIGLWGVLSGRFGAIWEPVPKGAPMREALAYLCAAVSVAAGLGMLWKRTAAPASRLLLAYLIVWFAFSKAGSLRQAPLAAGSWENCAESICVIAAAWVLYAAMADAWDRRLFGFASGETGLAIARVLYGLVLIVFGVAHLAYVRYTASLIPAWLPAHVAWVYFTGLAFIAAGLAILTGVWARMAATLSALQMGLFTLLVWGPVLAAGARDAFDLSETLLSWVMTAAGWVVADSYHGAPWLARKRR